MTKLCIKELRLNGLLFARGCDYKISYNSYDGRIYIYDVWGRYTDIPVTMLNTHFL